jgi:RNA polymerase sigma factor (sigma-70 family)
MMASGASVAGATDEQLVAAARAGSDEAFEALFRRYRDRIGIHVRGMVHDHGRAEDIVQETFISALRSLRATEQEIAFKPWIYQISRNACIDHLRRVKRTEEISIDSEDFKPDFEGRISEGAPTTDFAVLQRQDLDDLQQAFGGLPESQHEILVLRELEGLSYQEIGQRMHLTPAAVESMLSRARRSLKGQYDEIATGERCLRMRPVIAAATSGLAGKRDRRALERHVRHCRGCRQEALVMGLEELVHGAARPTRTRSVLSRAAALLPLPAIFRRRSTTDAEPAAGGGGVAANAHASLSHLSALGSVGADQTASVIQKAVAVVAVAAVAGGGGFAAHEAGVSFPLVKAHESKAQGAGGPIGDATGDPGELTSAADAVPGASLQPLPQDGATPGTPGAALPGAAGAVPPPAAGQGDDSGAGAAPESGTAPDGTTAPAGPVGPIDRVPVVKRAKPLLPDLAPGKTPKTKKPPTSPSDGPGTSPGDGGGAGGGGSVKVPPGVLHAPGLDGKLPPGIQKKLDKLTDPAATPGTDPTSPPAP